MFGKRTGYGLLIGIIAVLVIYPISFLVQASLMQGDGTEAGTTGYGLGNFLDVGAYGHFVTNTVYVSVIATAIAVVVGFLAAYALTRTNVPFRHHLSRLMAIPYYVTPLLGALAWDALGNANSGYINLLWRAVGGSGAIVNMSSAPGIAWVMALFEGSVAFVMISAVMQLIDPSLEEAAGMCGAGRFRSLMKVTLPLVMPGVLGATIFVFAEMLGSFSAALILGTPAHFYVLTTAIYFMIAQYPPRIPLAAAMGVILLLLMFCMMLIYRRAIQGRSFVTVSGKAFRPRPRDVGRLKWLYFLLIACYLMLSVVLPLAALIYISLQHASTAVPAWANFTLANYTQALRVDAVRYAIKNSMMLGLMAATVCLVLTGTIAWLLHRTIFRARGLLEYLSMLPQSVPRLVFAFGVMWAWLTIPIPLYGTIWLLLIAYVTVFIPLGLRSVSGVLMQIDRSLDECGKMCGGNWWDRLKTINIPLWAPGLWAGWMLIFIASVRELGTSILLVGPNSQVLAPAIVDSWSFSSSELTAAIAIIQTLVTVAAIVIVGVSMRASWGGGS